MTFLRDMAFFFKASGIKNRHVFWIWLHLFLKAMPFYLFPILTKIIVDELIPSRSSMEMMNMIFIGLIFGLFNIVFHVSFHIMSDVEFIKKGMIELQLKIAEKLQALEQSYVDSQQKGYLFSKMVISVEKIGQAWKQILNFVISNVFVIILSVFILVQVEWKMLLISLLLIPAFGGARALFRNHLKKLQHQYREIIEGFSQTVLNFIRTGFLSRIHGAEDFEGVKVIDHNQKMVDSSRPLLGATALFQSSISVLVSYVTLLIVLAGSYFIIYEDLLIGEFMLFIQYNSMLVFTILGVLNQYSVFLEFSENVTAVREVLGQKEQALRDGLVKLKPIQGDVDIRDLSFRYSEDGPEILKKMNCTVPRGQTVGIVGESGSGKSTLMKLLLGLYNAQEGEIRIDGHDLRQLDMKAYRSQVGVITQKPILFSGSLKENITHGLENIDLHQLIEACKRANAYEFISELPEKFDTHVQENGSNFSGGQRQRICIARVLLRNPKILIMDEATSALDNKSEALVQKAMEELFGSQTTFIIAHRLSTIYRADVIWVLKDGVIVESGAHDELIDKGGDYAALLSKQLKTPMEQLQAVKLDKS